MFEGPISNIKANKLFCLPPDKKNIFFSSLGQYKKIFLFITSVYLLQHKRYKIKCILVFKKIIKKKKRIRTGL